MASDKRDQLYTNLIGSGKVSEDEIGSLDEFKNAIKDEQSSREFYRNLSATGLFDEDEIGSEDDFYGSISDDFAKPSTGSVLQKSLGQRTDPYSQVEKSGQVKSDLEKKKDQRYTPSPSEMAGFNQTVANINRGVDAGMQRFARRAQNLQKRQGLSVPQRINLGESNNLRQGEQYLNPETGQLENTYITSSGNEYDSKAMAEQEQQQLDEEARIRQWRKEHPKDALGQDINEQIANLEQQREAIMKKGMDEAKQEMEQRPGIRGAIDRFLAGRSNAGPFGPNRAYAERAAVKHQDELSAIEVALQDLKDAKTRIERSTQLEASSDFLGGIGVPFTKDWFNNWKNFGYGVWDAMDNLAFNYTGSRDINKANMYLRIKNKMEKGEELTDQETAVALAGMSLAQAQQVAELPHGYTAGETTLNMAPFMFQMAGNPASGTGKAFARQAVRKFGRDGIKAVSTRVGARVLGNIAEGTVLANTLQAPATIANVMQRYTGDSFEYGDDGKLKIGYYDTDKDGNPVFVEGDKGVARSIWEGEASQIIENFTELGFGGNISKFLGKIASSGVGQKMGLGYLSDLVGKIGASPFARNMKNFMERTHWDGMIEEPLEEEYGIILNSLLTGDNSLSDLWDSEQQIDIFAGTMWFGGMMAAMNTAAYPYYRRKVKQELNQADVFGQVSFGDEWAVIKDGIDEMPDNEIANYLYDIKGNDAFSNDQKAALFAYVSRLKQYQGASTADMLMRIEGNLSKEETDVRNAYDRGTELTEPKDMNEAKTMMDYQHDRLSAIASDMIVEEFENNPLGALQGIINSEYWTDEEKQVAMNYVNARMTYEGMIDRVNDDIDSQITASDAMIDKRANREDPSVVIPATLTDDRQVSIVSGNVVMLDDGTGVDRQASIEANDGDGMILTVDESGKVEAHSLEDFRSVDEAIPVQQMKDEAAANIRQITSQTAADNIDGVLPFAQGDQYTILDEDGQQHTVEVFEDQGDGTVAVYEDGNPMAVVYTKDQLQTMNDAYLQDQLIQQEEQNQLQNAQAQPQNTQGAEAAGEAGQELTGGNEPAASALSRIPVRMDENGQPMKSKNGRPILDWHKVSVEDATDALIESTEGNMLDARNTANDLASQSKDKLEKIRKQKPKGEDPIEMAESRVAIRHAEEEQQAIIKQWQNVAQEIKRRMDTEAAERQAAIEAAKSEEQRQREAEEARIRKEKQDEQDRQRLREQIAKENAERNKVYEPLVKARKEMASDADAMDVLNDTEPRSLEEWVSSLLSPHSFLWLDASESERGLQTELGLKRADMQRFMTLFGNKENGAKPFGKTVLDIYEALPEGMKNMYTDEDVARVVRDMFQSMENSAQMMHLTELNRIEQARQVMQENERREEEAEMEAWAEAYHLTPEERETFEDFLQQQASDTEQEIINNIIADESYRTSTAMDQQPVSGTAVSGTEGSEGQVQQAAEATGTGTNETAADQSAEAQTGQPPVADNNVPGRTQSVDREALRELFRQIGADEVLADRISDYDVEQLTAMVEDWEAHNDDYGYVMEQHKDALKSKDKKVRDEAQKKVDEAQQVANEAFVPIEEYIEGLNVKYGIEIEEPFEGAIPTPKIDKPRYDANRRALIDAYKSGDPAAITAAAQAIQQYVDEGLDAGEDNTGMFDIAEDYDGNDPEKLADQYIIRTFWDRYLDDDSDQEYIKTGLKPSMRNDYKFVGKFEANEVGVCTNPNVITYKKNPKNINVGFEIRTAQTDKGWVGGCDAGGSTYGMGIPVTTGTNDRYFETEQECQAYWAQRALDYLESHHDKEAKNDPMAAYKAELRKIIGKSPVKQSEQLKPTDLRDVVRAESPEIGVNEANARAREAAGMEDQEVETTINSMKSHASVAPSVEITDENWQDNVETPIGNVKMGENQRQKMFVKGREQQYGMLLETLGRPDIVLEEQDKESDMFHERPSSYLFIKTFIKPDGSKFVHFESVTVSQDGMEVSISSHIIRENQLKNKLKSDRLLYKATALDEPANSSAEQPTSEGSGLSSESKGTKNSGNNQENLGKTSSREEISSEEAKVDTNPTDAQKEAGNYQKGHIMVDGYDITIENPKGSIRRGTDASGKQWEQEMHNTYGYIKGTEGVDGDHIDVFLSDNPASGKVWVVDQVNKDGSFDEHKVMYGFANVADATKAYLSNYEEGWQGLGAISGISREEFKKWIESSHRKTKPFREYALAKSAEAKEKKNASKPAKEHKRIVSDEKMEELRKQLLDKFNNMNEGIDVERMLLGAMYAVGKIERGVTKFADYATQMVDEIGDAIRPYLKAFYEAVRNMPEAAPYRDQMTPADEVAAFDEYNFDKQRQPDVFTKAEQVVKKSKAKQQVKKIEKEVNQKLQQGNLFAGDLFSEPEPAKEERKAQEPAKRKEPKLRPATEADLENEHPIVYLNGHPYNIIAVMRSGEQISATQFSKPKVDSVMLTNGKSVKLEDLMVEDENAGKEKPKPKTPWWNDSNRPQSIDPSDYRTYMTDEARKYFASHPAFGDWKRKEIAFVTAAVWDGVVIPYEALKDLPEIVAAEQVVKDATANGVLQISEEERDQHAQRLLDAEHGSAIFENGKIKKVNGVEDFSGPVRQERKALVIIGYPAAGKSSVFANRLSNELGARIIDSDTVKPWLKGFDGGNGAGYVQEASSEVAERALDIAVGKGDNIILPRIGGGSVIALSAALKLAGYDVQLYFNDVATVTSVDRATSRFAETGRYLSLQYLTSKDGVPSKNFINFAEKNIGDYINELSERKVQELRGRLRRLLESETVDGTRLWQSLAADQGGYRTLDEYVSVLLEPRGTGVTSRTSDLIFSYSEWKSNDVAFGEKPKEIWNSKSGKPMPTKEVKDNGVQSEQRLPGKPSSSGEGEGQEGRGTGRVREGLGSESNRDQYVGPEHSVTNQPAQPKQAPKHNNKRNNSGERGKDYAPTSPKARFNANVEAIKMMRELIDQGIEAPTKDQMEVLRQYSGWGGLGTYFNDESSAENKILRDLLDEEEYNDAVMSVNSAYYTPATVIDTLWDVAKAMGFKGGNIVEGSAGIGNIIGQMPKDISRQSNIEAVEIDKISGNILKLLYPDAKVHIQGFQDTVIRNGSVDLAITNVPFVTGLHVIDKVDKDLSRRFTNIHDFCIAKNIRKLREGGLGIFITSSGTLDKSTDLRAWITDEGQADVVGAFRLNNETFGGTKVTSDIIVVRKRVNGVKSSAAIDVSKASPLRVGTYEDKYGDEHQTTMVVNDYFKEHPEMMAGEMAFGYEKGDTFRPGSYGLYPVESKSQDKMMAKFVKSMGDKADTSVPQQQPQQVAEPNQLTAVKEGRMLIDDNGRICVSRYGEAVPLGLNDQKVKGQTKQQCFKDYQAVQAAVDDVLQQQLNDPNDEALKPKLAALNKAYDLFTKRYGTLHKNTAISFLRNDIDFPSFQALELYREEKDINGKVKVITAKPKLFSERVIGFKTEPQPKTVKDAVIASIFRTNGIDLDWIASKLNEVAAPPHGDKWTTEDVRKGILVSRLGFEDPSTGQLVIRYKYLSGNVREKLAIAEQYNTEGETAGRYAANVEELKKAVPMGIPAHLIDFSLGSSWIPVELYKDFVKETFDLNNVRIAHIEGSWAFDEGFSFRNEKNRSAGVYSEKFRETIYGHQLFASALNNRPYKVSKQVTEGWGSSKTTHTEVDQAATQACNVRIDEIKAEFREWTKKKMQDDPELARRIEKIYNEKFNALVPMEVGEEFLPERFEGANTGITLRPHQKLGAIKGLISPTMLAHEVGTGKSFTLITTAMEMRRLGTAKKPMIVVQNATVAQLTADAKLLYPNAKVLSLSEQDRDAEGRRAFYAKIKYNDWDIIIVPQSTFERIPDSPERELQFIQEKIDEKKHVIEAAQAAGVDSRDLDKLKRELEKIEQEYGDKSLDSDPANASNAPKRKKKDAKREAASLDKAETRAKEQLDRAVDDVQFFDDLGVDALLVDEAHEYKHLGFQTSMGRGIKGIDPSYSKKCAGLYNKTRSVYEKAGWKNVVFATGTPISNTAAEIWTFMKYLMPADVMRANDIYYFDDFVHNFGNVSQMLEFTTSGKFKENTRFAAYVNKPELIRIWSQVADTVRSADTEVKDKEPEEEGGKDQDVFLPQSPSLIRIMAAVRAELERFENMTGQQKKENSSIPLTMYGIAKRAAIDPRLVDAEAPDEPLSKTNAAVKEILIDLKATQSYKGTVAVFCDNQNRLGINSTGKKVVDFNIYDDMKEKLIKAGVPEKQISIVKSGMSITAKQKIFDAVNSGDIRVVLGSTQTLGTGVNMQERLHLLIHMDAPDRPMDYTQRNGRIKRQGNLHKEWGKTIRIVRFGVEDSLDVTAYQRLKTKSGFIDSIMNGKAALADNQTDRTVEEEEEGLFDNPVAVLSGSQYALKKNQAERELRKYQGKKAQWEADQIYVVNQIRHNANELEAYKANIDKEQKQLDKIKSMFPDGTVKTITVEGVKIDMTKDDGAKKLGEAIKEKINDPVNAIVKRNRENAIYNDETLEYTIGLDGHNIKFTVKVVRESLWENGKMKTIIHKYTSYSWPELNMDSMDSSRSVRDYLDEIIDQVVTGQDSQDRIDAMQQAVSRINAETEQIQNRVGQPFQYGKELEEAEKNVEEYTALMKKEMEEKEAKYAEQQKEAEADGNGFNLNKAEEESEDEDLYRADEDWDEPVFYSNAEMAVESIRQEKATPEQWLAMIQKNGGIKAGEDKWLGLSDWLINNEKRTLTKQEVLDFVKANQIEVQEERYQEQEEMDSILDGIYEMEGLEFRDEFADAFEIYDGDIIIRDEEDAVNLYNSVHVYEQPLKYVEDDLLDEDTEKTILEWANELVKEAGTRTKEINKTRLQYTTAGLKNKREIALTVPSIQPYKQDDAVHFGDAGGGRAVAWVRFGETTDADGNKVLVIDEIQSKRHQDAREKGYVGDVIAENKAKAEEMRKRHQELVAKRDELIDRDMEIREAIRNTDRAKAMLGEDGYIMQDKVAEWQRMFDDNKELDDIYRQRGAIVRELRDLEQDMRVLDKDVFGKVPDAPFEKNWHELAMKRMLRYAAENGYDKVAWTTGEQQAKRYDLAQAVSSIDTFEPDDYAKEYGEYRNIQLNFRNNSEPVFINIDKDGKVMSSEMDELGGKQLADIVGKELSLKIMQDPAGLKYQGNDLQVGGEGMKGFYDQMLVRYMNKYGKKWGVQVGQTKLPRINETMWSIDVTPEMKASVMQGQPMFRGMEEFEDGQLFPINVTYGYGYYDILGRTPTYSTDLMPDVYNSEVQMIDAIRRQYPTYYAHIEDGNVVMESWRHVMGAADGARQRKDQGSKSYVERKTRNAINAVNSLARQMGLDVEVLTTTEGLEGKKARAKGWFNSKTGKITLVLPNHANRSDLINTLLHEGVAHFGLRKMFGQSFNTFLDNVYNNVSPEIKKRIDAAMKRNGWSRHEATEEYLARLAERTDFEHATNQGWWQKIKDFFLQMLTKAGVVMDELTDNELRYILWRSYDNLLHPDRRRNIFDKAREVNMQYQLRVGQYSDRERQRIQRTGKADTSWMAAEEELLNSTDYASDEINAIVDKAMADGAYMLAPNGKPSNLNELQWAQVRTKAFKEWFGDWENDPENASKVVDENGEPKVMYHKTNLDVVNKGIPFYTFYEDSHFGTKGQANDRVRSNDSGVKMYEVFLNIRNPQRRQDANEDYLEDKDMSMTEYWQLMADRSKSQGHDGIVYLNEYEDKEHPADSWIAFSPNQIKSATENSGDFSTEDNDIRYSIRTKEPPKKTGVGYKVFVLKDGQLYPPMVANPNGEGTPVGVWLDADAAPVAGTSKTGRPQVKAGGKGTQGGSGQLAYRPGWHLGTIPYALQFGRKDANGERTLFPNNFVWAEVEYADDVNYQDEARQEGVNANGKYQHSLAGLKHVPTDGSYMYRTNPDPRTDPWVITGAMRVKKILTRDEVDELVRKAGREPQQIQDGDIVTDEAVKELNDEIKATIEADEMGLLYRDDDAWADDVAPEDEAAAVARSIYNDAVRVTGNATMVSALFNAILSGKKGWEQFKHQFSESWFDYSRSIKALQDAIEKATGKAVAGFEDVWRSLNAKSSIDNIELQEVMRTYIEPLSEYVGSIIKGKKIDGENVTIDDVEKYLNAVHGQERNVAMAMKQAQDEYDEDTQLLRQQLENTSLTPAERSSIENSLLKKEARFKGVKNYMHYPSIAKWWHDWNMSVERGHNNGTLSDEEYNKVRKKMATEYNQGWQYKYRDKDYSGLTALFAEDVPEGVEVTESELEELARDYAAKFEDVIGKAECEELWNKVKALNNYSLRKSYLSGLISKQQYDDTMSMYEHYVPLRGWHDDYAGDVYQYISRGEPAEVLQGVLKKAYGRKSRAARIFGTMAAMANTAIVQGNKNTVAQKLLNLAMSHTDAGLLMVTEQWYRKDANDNLVPEFPNLREDMTAEEMQEEIERFEADMKEREERGEVETLRKKFKKEMPLNMAKWQEQRHAVRVLRNGKEYMVYVLGDPRAAEAFNGLLNPHSQPGAISNVLSRYMRFRAKWQTSLSPEFLISNFQRDVTTATTGAYVKFGKETSKQFAKNLAKVMPMTSVKKLRNTHNTQNLGGIFSLLRKYDQGTLNHDNDIERYFDEFVRNGGMTGISYITRSEEYQASMEDMVKRMRQGKLAKPRQWAEAVGNAVEFANKGIENATRFAMFMTSRQQGKTIVQSIFDAKEASVNFNMKGSGAWGNMMARRLYLYVNPAMQALRMLGTWYENDPMVATKEGAEIVTKAVGKRFMKAATFTLTASIATAVLNMLLSALLGHGDDDDDNAMPTDWWSLSEWNRYNYVNIVNPFGKGYFHWNLPQELRPIWAMGQIAVDGAFGKITPQHGFNAMLSQLNNITPLSFFEGGTTADNSTISSLIRTFTPTFVGEFTDAYGWNRDFMGHWITNQSSWNEDAPEWQRASEGTPKWIVGLSKQLNDMAPNGRTNNRSDWESRYLNPSAVYYILTQQYGGMGTMGKRLYQLIEQAADPEQDMEIRNVPFIPKFYVSTGDDYSSNRVMNEKFRMYWDEYKATDSELARDRKAVKDGSMSQEDADKTIEERKNDGSYQSWKAVHDNYLNKLYEEVRGTKEANKVKQMIVDAIEHGKAPDFTGMDGKIYENAIKRQKTSKIDDMSDEEMQQAFNESTDSQMRSLIAKRIATSAGASKDVYGEKSSVEYANIYQELRTANDVYEDALLYGYYEQAKESGNDELKEQIRTERDLIRQYAKDLDRQYPADNASIMEDIRSERSTLIRRLHNMGIGNR